MSMANTLANFKTINTFVFDVDGVLTDGTVWVLDGLQARRMNIKDGFALQMATRHGYRVLIISGGNSPQVVQRLEKLGITDVHMAVEDKPGLLAAYMNKHGLKKEQVLYMGDDLPDLPVMAMVGMSCCPADAVEEIRQTVSYVSHLKGGDACVRDVIEKVLKLNDHWTYEPDIRSR
jgi:3-deoxy-D-manno-octulosonate 8-phosphate phosphatase (KDO 8-P phosphatase)